MKKTLDLDDKLVADVVKKIKATQPKYRSFTHAVHVALSEWLKDETKTERK